MSNFFNSLRSEMLKIFFAKITYRVLGLILIVQTLFAYLGTKQILQEGLNATPETNSQLIEAIPPLEYLGFDVTSLGILVMIVWGASYGGLEYQNQTLRTTLLGTPSKKTVFTTKFILVLIYASISSFISIYGAIAMTHWTLGAKGLHPLFLNSTVWRFIGLSLVAWLFLTLLAYLLGFLAQTAIVPLLFLIPQVYNLGQFLAERFSLGKILPVALSNQLLANGPTSLAPHPVVPILGLTLWILVLGGGAFLRFYYSELGSEG